jgi:hypothetical protein
MTEDVNLIYSPLNRYIIKDCVEIEICIYKGEPDTVWCLEVIDQFGNSTCWNDQFKTDQEAMDEVLAAIETDGIISFLGLDPNVAWVERFKPKSKQVSGLTHDFLLQAAALWKNIPEDKKQIIINNVYCGQCHTGVTMVDFNGFTEGSSLILQGFCDVCGKKVARVIEDIN